ncbi:MAG: hypothetical protein C0399_05750 [Syntrophus sp. (in: bacteria)]|nr:hypothetical protein [Syntrophus sp. (in: bacteria)]
MKESKFNHPQIKSATFATFYPETTEEEKSKIGRWIPGEANYNPELKPAEASLFGLIYVLTDKGEKACTMFNQNFADDLRCSKVAIRKYLQALEDLGYIRKKVYFNEQREVVKREITLDPDYKQRYGRLVDKEIYRRSQLKEKKNNKRLLAEKAFKKSGKTR